MKNEDFYSEPYKPKEFWTVDREFKPSYEMVGVQGFEPWTPWSQTRCATRLRYTPKNWCPHHDSNTAPTDYKSVALPDEL